MVLGTCLPSYAGDINRRIAVQVVPGKI
jgi:hypothetical protein